MGKKKKKQEIEDDNRRSIQMYCKYCGHTNTIPVYVEEKICRWCKHKIKNTTQAHFSYKIMNMLKEKNNE